jgi:DNA-binding FrmR family transcriptional regulator
MRLDSDLDTAAAEGSRTDRTRRLSRAEGQLRGIQRMIEDRRDCAEIVNQLLAVRAALDRVIDLELENGLKDCMRSLPADVAEKEVSRLVGMVARVGSGARR